MLIYKSFFRKTQVLYNFYINPTYLYIKVYSI